ncbi:MAG: class I SAM-dependent methyltransferase [Lachnospiraceae bacterium]|nr:class I SAM-dependent methyltransferase [Lachnospiraceae bacterium]
MKLSPRLEKIISLVPEGSRICDIGCDHGYTSIELVSRGIAKSAVAMDVREGPLMKAKENITAAGLSDLIEIRLSDGFTALDKGEADTAVISGMGGRLMQKIIREAADRELTWPGGVETLICQPQSELGEFRAFLREMGYRQLRNEAVKEDDKFYFVIVVSAAGDPVTAAGSIAAPDSVPAAGNPTAAAGAPDERLLDRYGADLIERRDPILGEYLRLERDKYENIISGLIKNNASPDILREKEEYLEDIKKTMEVGQYG